MKKLLMAASALSMIASTQAFADADASDQFDLNLSVEDTCVLGTPTLAITGGGADTDPADGIDLFDAAITADGASLAGLSAEVKFGDSYCNYAHSISIASSNDGLASTTAANDPVSDSDAFAESLNYTATVANWNQNPTYTTTGGAAVPVTAPTTATEAKAASGTAGEATVAGAFRNDAVVSTTPQANDGFTLTFDGFGVDVAGAPLVAGEYDETVFIQIGAAI